MNSQFNATVVIKNKSKQQYTGILSITTALSLSIESITIEISFIATGTMRAVRKEIISIDLLSYSKSLAIGKQEFPFDFSLDESSISSYYGKNVTITYECRAKIYLDDENYRKLDISLFKNILTYVKKKNQIIAVEPFDFQQIESEYNAVDKMYELALLNPTVLILAGFIYVPSYLYLLFKLHYISVFSVIFGVIFGGLVFLGISYGIYYLFIRSSGKMMLHVSPYKKNQFQCKISGLRLIRNPKIHYRIIEKVVDNRGTSSNTRKHTVYTSSIKELPSSNTVLFDYPSDKKLASFKIGKEVELYWEVVIKGNKNSLYGKFTVQNKA
jgi:hypothetical protein